MKFENFDTDEKVFIIAEIGNNHEGNLDVAFEMLRTAAACGANAVKFQTIVPERLVSIKDTNRIDQLTRFQFSPDQFRQLRDEAERHQVLFLSTPFDPKAVDWLDELVPAWKIASGDNDFFPLIDRVAATGKPIIASMGLGKAENAKSFVDFVHAAWLGYQIEPMDLGLLHCRVSYPTPLDEAGLGFIESLKIDGVTPGYSDHTIGIRAAELAVAAGARIIEKHFTLDKNYSEFRDHQLSADPDDLTQLVTSIREIESMFRIDTASELANESAVRRSIAAASDLPIGHTVSESDLCWVRPGTGLRPGSENELCGRTLSKPIGNGDAFTMEHVE